MKLFSAAVRFGALVLSILTCHSCAIGYDTEAIRAKMKQFVEEESGREFKFIDLKQHWLDANSKPNEFWGELEAADDVRIRLYVMARVDDSIITIMNPEQVKTNYRKTNMNAEVTDQSEIVAKKYLSPEFVHAEMYSEAEKFRINIYITDKLDQKKLGEYYLPKVKKIAQEIAQRVLNPDEHYSYVNLQVFENGFDKNKIMNNTGVVASSELRGDYIIECDTHDCSGSLGVSSDLRYAFEKRIQKELSLKKLGDVISDNPVDKSIVAKDYDENGFQVYKRFFGAIWDEDRKNVIDRKFVRINIFTGEMEWYTPEKFPR